MQAGPDKDDWTLVGAACAGDRDAHGALYDRHAAFCFSFACRLVRGNRERAEEILVDVFAGISASAAAASHAPSDVRLWLLSLVLERCRENVKDASWLQTMAGPLCEPTQEPGTGGNGTIDVASIRLALAGLPAAERRIIELAYFDRRSCAEIGEIMGLRPEIVRASMRRGLHTLHRTIRTEGLRTGRRDSTHPVGSHQDQLGPSKGGGPAEQQPDS